jgi:hypothetical protein
MKLLRKRKRILCFVSRWTRYEQIEKDLKEAADVLPVEFTGNNIDRATKGTAQGLLRKVHGRSDERL